MTPTPKVGRPAKLDNPRRVIAALPEEMIERLDAVAATERVTRSEAIRWAIEEWIRQHGQPEP